MNLERLLALILVFIFSNKIKLISYNITDAHAIDTYFPVLRLVSLVENLNDETSRFT